MEKRSTKVIMLGLILTIIGFAIANIIEFRIIEFYSMLVLMFFLIKYVYIMNQ